MYRGAAAGSPDQQAGLAGVIAGDVVLAWCFQEPGGDWTAASVGLEVALACMPTASVRFHDQAPFRDVCVDCCAYGFVLDRKLSLVRATRGMIQKRIQEPLQFRRWRLICLV